MVKLHFSSVKQIATVYNYDFQPETLEHEDYLLKVFNQEEPPVDLCSTNVQYLFIAGCYYRSINRNYDEMEKYFLKAIDAGDANSMLLLSIHHFSSGDVHNDKIAKYMQILAKDLKSAYAISSYATLFMKHDRETARECLKIAVELNYEPAMLEYAIKHEENAIKKYNLLRSCVEKFKNTTAMIQLGKLHEQIGDVDNMKKYYQNAIDGGNNEGYMCLSAFYYKINDFENAKQSLIDGVNKGCIYAMEKLAGYYLKIDKTNEEQAMELLDKSAKNGNMESLYKLIDIYGERGDEEQMLHYMQYGVSVNDETTICNMATFYEKKRDYEKMKELLHHGIAIFSTNASSKMANYYEKIEHNRDEMKKYHMILLENLSIEQTAHFTALAHKYTPIEYYFMLQNIKNKPEIVKSIINSMHDDKNIRNYNNKLALSDKFNIITDLCIICHEENKKALPFNCAHICCVDCFVRVNNVCPFCK